MKRITTIALMVSLAIGSAYAQHPVNMTLSGTAAASTVDMGTGTPTSEYNLAENGTLGAVTFRTVTASTASPQPQPSTCSGPNKIYGLALAGEGVFRSQDGSLLKLNLSGGSDCIDLSVGAAQCIRIYQINGGTDRFKNASGTVTLTMTVTPLSGNNPVFFTVTATFSGTISGVSLGQGSQDAQH
jgi:hypothetical protein